MAYSAEIKEKVLEKIRNREKIKDIAREFGISISTIYNWKNSETKKEETTNVEKETSKKIKILIKYRKFDEAIILTEKYPNNPIIQSQRITIAIKRRDYKKAKEIGERFPDYAPIQSQMITIAIKEGIYKKAKEIGERFPDYAPIQSQMITIAIKEGNYKKVKEIRERFPDYAPIQSQINEIENEEDFIIEQLKDEEIFSKSELNGISDNKKEELNKIKTKIYCKKIDDQLIEEINNSKELNEYERTIILLLICEIKKISKRAKQIAKSYSTESKEERKSINSILNRIESKKTKILDMGIYDDILKWELDSKLLENYKEEKIRTKKVKKQKEKEPETKIKTSEKIQKTNVKEVAKKIVEESDNTKGQNKKEPETKIKTSEKIQKTNVKEVTKKIVEESDNAKGQNKKERDRRNMMVQYIESFIEDSRKKIYVSMQSMNNRVQKKAIDNWDRLEVFRERFYQNKEDLSYIENIYDKMMKIMGKGEAKETEER